MRNSKDGILVVDKPQGISSHGVVKRIKKILGAAKVGHTGTLDPFATGVLCICLNQATKAAQFFLEDDKEYLAEMFLGVETDTLDVTGNITARFEMITAGVQDIRRTAGKFVGRIRQRTPLYSAVKVNGKPLYKAARKGEKVDPPERIVTVYALDVLAVKGPRVTFHIKCSKGVYVRAIAADWGRQLGCGAHLSALRRTRSGPFTLEYALSWEELESEADRGGLADKIISINQALSHWPELTRDEKTADKVRHGHQLRDRAKLDTLELNANDKIRLVLRNRALIAIMIPILDDREEKVLGLKSLRVFNP